MKLIEQKKEVELFEVMIPSDETQQDTLDFIVKTREEQLADILSVISSSLSVSFGILLTFLNITINFAFAGDIDDENITGGIGLCVSILNCLAIFFTFGLNQGCGSQAARALGSNSIELMKNYYNKGLFTVFLIMCYLGILSLLLERVLILIGQDQDIAHYAWIYFTGILPGLAFMFYFDLIRVIYNAMGMFNEPMYMQFFSIIIQYFCCWLFVTKMGHGFSGIILSTNISYFSLLLMIIFYSILKKIDLKPNFNLKLILTNYANYLLYCFNIAIPGVIDSVCIEFNSVLIGTLKIKAQFNAHVIYSNFAGLLFSFSLGIGGALCTLISNSVGENNFIKSKNYFKISYFVVGLQYLIGIFIFIFLGQKIANFYSNDDDTVFYFMKVLNIHKYFLVFDYFQGSQSGIMKAIGEGKQCIKNNIISYSVGNSLSYIFGVVYGYGVVGTWGSLCIALLLIFILQTRFLLIFQWKSQINTQYELLMDDKKALEMETIETNPI